MNPAVAQLPAVPAAPAASGRESLASGFSAILTGLVAAFGWTLYAGRFRGELYGWEAVGASAVLLGIAVAGLRWRPSLQMLPLRIAAILVGAESFQFAGMPILSPPRRDEVPFNATPEAFSSNVMATALFAVSFLTAIAAALSLIRRALIPARPGSSQPRDISLAVAAIFICVTITNIAYGGVKSPLAGLGMLPVALLNEGMIIPLATAAAVAGSRASRWLLGLSLTVSAAIAAWSTMLGSLLMPVRSVLLTLVALRRRGVSVIVAVGAIGFFIVNPAKALVREEVALYGPAQTFDETIERWQRALLNTWTGRADVDKNVDKSARRLDYNSTGAAVFAAVPALSPFKGGETYAEIPTLMIPRIILPTKGDTKDLRSRLTIEIGIQAAVNADTASMALPAPAEAYWNFGWTGVVMVSAILGLIAAVLYRLAPDEPLTAVGFFVFVTTSLATFTDMLFNIVPQIAFVIVARLLFGYLTRPRPDLVPPSNFADNA